MAGNPGQAYTDLDTNDFYVKWVGTAETGWIRQGLSVKATLGGGGGSPAVTGGVYSGTATDPNGVITATAPAYYYSITDQSQWNKVDSGSSNTGWVKFLG